MVSSNIIIMIGIVTVINGMHIPEETEEAPLLKRTIWGGSGCTKNSDCSFLGFGSRCLASGACSLVNYAERRGIWQTVSGCQKDSDCQKWPWFMFQATCVLTPHQATGYCARTSYTSQNNGKSK